MFKKEGGEAGDAIILAVTDTGVEEIGLFEVVPGGGVLASREVQGG